MRRLPVIGLVGAFAAFGAASLVLAAMGLGVPFLAAALGASGCAGLVVYAASLWVASAAAAEQDGRAPALEERIKHLEESTAGLRHDLRGVLSPALMMADRLLKNEDPVIRRAGQAVVGSVERATALLAENKRQTGATPPATPDAAAPPPRSPAGGTDAPGP